jgi:Outer membrane protein beta-barrel domain
MRRHLALVPGVLGMLVLATPLTGLAQERALGVVGGVWEYDLSGTGTTGFGGLRLEWPLHRVFLVEPALTYSRYTAQFGTAVNYLIPEVQGQVQYPGRVLRPFLGAGLGLSYAWADGASATDLTLTAGVGTRVRVTEFWSVRGELRARSIDPFHATIAEWTLGVARRF